MEIRVATSPEDRAACLNLRRVVFIEEQSVPEAEEVDGIDDDCTHILAIIDGHPVGAARLNGLNEGYAKIQRVCVLPETRGTGIGAKIIRHMVDLVRNEGQKPLIRLGAQLSAIDFYRKLGFQECGEDYMDAGIPHRDMEMAI